MTMYPPTDHYFACPDEDCDQLLQVVAPIADDFEPVCVRHAEHVPMEAITFDEFVDRLPEGERVQAEADPEPEEG